MCVVCLSAPQHAGRVGQTVAWWSICVCVSCEVACSSDRQFGPANRILEHDNLTPRVEHHRDKMVDFTVIFVCKRFGLTTVPVCRRFGLRSLSVCRCPMNKADQQMARAVSANQKTQSSQSAGSFVRLASLATAREGWWGAAAAACGCSTADWGCCAAGRLWLLGCSPDATRGELSHLLHPLLHG